MPPIEHPVFFVVGATGTGKTKAAVLLSQKLQEKYRYSHVVILNCDATQFYDGLPICTNKATVEEMGGISHVFLSFLDVDGKVIRDPFPGNGQLQTTMELLRDELFDKEFKVHSFERCASAFIDAYFECNQNGAVVVCGGSCYYAQSLIFQNSLVNDAPCNGIAHLCCAENPSGELWASLNAVDSVVASRYHPNDTRRIQRLLDIYKTTGTPPSEIFSSKEEKLRFDAARTFVVWTWIERSSLNDRLDARVDHMIENGMLDEVRALLASGEAKGTSSSLADAIGFKEFAQFLVPNSGTVLTAANIQTAVQEIKCNTRRYARQQERWISNRLLPLLKSVMQSYLGHVVKLSTECDAGIGSGIEMTVDHFFDVKWEGNSGACSFPLRSEVVLREPVSQEHCAICDSIVYGRNQMDTHLQSKRHRGAVRRQRLEKDHYERFGWVLPLSKRKRSL